MMPIAPAPGRPGAPLAGARPAPSTRSRSLALLLAGLLAAPLLAPGRSAAQTGTPAEGPDRRVLPDGARVRARLASGERVTGWVRGLRRDTLVIGVPGAGYQRPVPLDSLARLEVAREGGHAVEGGLVGLLVGGVAGYYMGRAWADDQQPGWGDSPSRTEGGVLGAAIGVALGATAGAGVGSRIRTVRWIRVDPGRLRFAAHPAEGGVTIAVSLVR